MLPKLDLLFIKKIWTTTSNDSQIHQPKTEVLKGNLAVKETKNNIVAKAYPTTASYVDQQISAGSQLSWVNKMN